MITGPERVLSIMTENIRDFPTLTIRKVSNGKYAPFIEYGNPQKGKARLHWNTFNAVIKFYYALSRTGAAEWTLRDDYLRALGILK